MTHEFNFMSRSMRKESHNVHEQRLSTNRIISILRYYISIVSRETQSRLQLNRLEKDSVRGKILIIISSMNFLRCNFRISDESRGSRTAIAELQSVIAVSLAIEVNEKLFPDRGKKETKRNFLARFFDFLFDDSEANTLLFNDGTKKSPTHMKKGNIFADWIVYSLQSTVCSPLISDHTRVYFDATLSFSFSPIYAPFFPRSISIITVRLHRLSLLFPFSPLD